jgi:hypothetical protein
MLLSVAQAEPTRLPAGETPSSECVAKGNTQGDLLKAVRAACDLLAYAQSFGHGFVRPCNSKEEADLGATCDDLATTAGCDVGAGERLWYCFGVGSN